MSIDLAVALGRFVELYLAEPLYSDIRNEFNDTKVHRWINSSRPDVVTTFGGDGLLLYANSLFQSVRPPPIIPFSGGSLGFLAPFDADDRGKDVLESRFAQLLDGEPPAPWPVSLRMRLRCSITSENATTEVVHEALNEVVIDRGESPFLSAVDCFCNDIHLTTVQADGLIVATPTGSTAYSLAAGGPMLHPSSPSIVLTPICPHTLSIRPIVFPDSANLTFHIDDHARSDDAWVTFDGRTKIRLRKGDTLTVSASPHPIPTLLRFGNTADWFAALREAFQFNQRPPQKPLVLPEGI